MEKDNKVFLSWINSLKRYERSFYIRRIGEICDVSRVTVYLWIKGESEIRLPYRYLINQIAGKELFDVEPLN